MSLKIFQKKLTQNHFSFLKVCYNKNEKMFIAGFDYVINKLKPKNVIVYGRMPDKIFCLAKMYGINLIQFESEFALSRKKGVV